MPVFQRKQLRQALGLDFIRDTLVGTTALSLGANANVAVMDRLHANLAFSGELGHQRAWLRVASYDYLIASFNAGSGAYVTSIAGVNAIPSGADFEVHHQVSPTEKDRVIDQTIRRVRYRQEVGFPSIDGARHYSLAYNLVASPNALIDVLDCYYFADPSASANRDKRHFDHWEVAETATGPELRVWPALAASKQIVLDAILEPTLAAGDAATINLPDDQWILIGAAVRAYDLLAAEAGAKEVKVYKDRRTDLAREYSKLSARFQPLIERKVQFGDPWEE